MALVLDQDQSLDLLIKKNKIQIVHTNTVFSIDAALAAKLARLPHCLHIREITGTAKDATLKLFFQGLGK